MYGISGCDADMAALVRQWEPGGLLPRLITRTRGEGVFGLKSRTTRVRSLQRTSASPAAYPPVHDWHLRMTCRRSGRCAVNNALENRAETGRFRQSGPNPACRPNADLGKCQ